MAPSRSAHTPVPRRGTEHPASDTVQAQGRAEEFLPPSRPPAEPPREALMAWDDAHCWHPFTPQSVYRDDDPLLVVAGDGHYLIDMDGRRYLDGVSSLWCNLFGHRRPEIDEAIRRQLTRIAHSTFLGHANVPAVTLAARLVKLAPRGLTRVFYSDDGSTAVEAALKMAFQFWQQTGREEDARRTRFLTLEGAHHGDTIGAASVGTMPLARAQFGPLFFETLIAPTPEDYLARLDDAGSTLAAAILEPGIQCAAGMLTEPPGFVAQVREAATRAGTLLIADEAAIGFGRSGRMFACEREGIAPDLLCLAKGLTGGYLPMAATLASERIYEGFLGAPEERRTFLHGHTYSGNQLAASAALATLDIFEATGLLQRVPAAIEYFEEVLSRLDALPNVGQVRQYGLAAGVELVASRAGDRPFPPAERRGARVCRAARKRGVFLRPLGDVIVLMPPLTVTPAEQDLLVDAVAAAIAEVCGDAA